MTLTVRVVQNDGARRMEQLEREVDRWALWVATEIERETKERAPVFTGTLRRSYSVQPIANGYIVGTNVEYAPFVEFGTRYTTAQPHLAPAFEAVAVRAGDELVRRVRSIR